MTSGYRNAAGVDFDDLFDPDTVGDGQAIGNMRRSNGVALQYANVKYGAQGPAVSYRTSAGVDVSSFWAKKGTTKYLIPTPSYNNQFIAGTGHGSITTSIL